MADTTTTLGYGEPGVFWMAKLGGAGEALVANARRWSAPVISVSAISVGALMWLVGAMTVALPTNLFNLDVAGATTEFFSKPVHPATVLILWIIDVVVAIGILRDIKVRQALTKGTRSALCFAAIGVFIFVGILVPFYARGALAIHPYPLALIALLSILIPRGLSYAPPLISRKR